MNGKHKAAHSPWPMVRLGDVGEMIRGSGIKRTDTVEKGFPCLRYGEIYTSYNYVLDQPRSFVPKEVFDKSLHIKSGDLVLTLTGETKEEIAKTLAYLGEDEIAAGGDLAVWTGHGCDPLYLAYLMYSPTLIKAKSASSNGNIIVHTSIKRLRDISIPIPPLPAQRKIVARLKKELAEVDRLSAAFKRLAALADEQFKSELDVAVNGCSKNYVSLESICEPIKDGTHQTPIYTDDSQEGVKFLSSKDVTTGVINWQNVKYIVPELHAELCKRVAPRKGDILLAKNGTTGVAALVDRDEVFDIYVTLALLRLKKGCDAEFVLYVLNSPFAKQQFNRRLKGIGVPNLHLVEIRQVKIPMPSLSDQMRIAKEIGALKERFDNLTVAATRGAALCEELRKSILTEAFA